ncbi:MAG: carotenoid oxygenase family protein [Pseudomonadota bacterium]
MIKRRSVLKAGLVLPLGTGLLSACGSPGETLGFYQQGMYLSGNFAPVDVEFTATDLPVKGRIPPELTGRYLRNGPNPLGDVNAAKYHWFLGDGMVHGIRLEDGRAAWYRNRWVRSQPVVAGLGEGDGSGAPGFGPNTNVIGHAGRTFAIVESGQAPVELGDELGTVGEPAGWPAYTAHPKLDPDTGELHAIAYDWANLRDHVKYHVIDRHAKLVRSIDIPMQGMTMIHDMSLTQNHVVIYDLPVTVSLLALAGGARFPFRWDEGYNARIGLMPRNGGPADIRWSSLAKQYAYHPMNAYENATGEVVIDIVRYDRMFAADTHGPFGDSEPSLARWTLRPGADRVSEVTVDERAQEFPRIHPGLNSKPYRYGYTLVSAGTDFPAIRKHDMQTGQAEDYSFGEGRQGGEPCFVPAQRAAAEDDGYLLSIVYDENKRTSELLILDARDMAAPPLAAIQLPARVPYGFHGNWIADT